ncbi:hypothetical protein [Enterovibrio nigricans]|uniref:Uncharacterized protein n=1 Tax=Enterovibrio nigricans DSM 22720 TaxID=1121868 RepID=A0A1T4U347_9GAMM|nr:hypothetical protein [Enterovibrio nigricans]SKA46979.1 hypothetical protein SAMN02745132_00614 [Enterovibrio nigricans DSM 22720]
MDAISFTLIPSGQVPEALYAQFPSINQVADASQEGEIPMLVAEKTVKLLLSRCCSTQSATMV